jgi:septal ring-binding cell division protein DamX
MEQPALREVERRRQWQDKIEVRLDNRQVFFLFFGSAVVACMLFVLGVLVGKRIESRGRAEAPEVLDPLAVLDRASPAAPAAAAAAAAPAPVAEVTFPTKLIAAPARPRPAPQAARPAPEAAPPAPKAAAAPPKLVVAAPPKPVVVAAPPRPAAPPRLQAKGKFTLHLANFATKDDADAFARKFAAQGAFVVASDVPEKGTVYRVRCGNFATLQEATTAKASFEKQNRVIALVAAR